RNSCRRSVGTRSALASSPASSADGRRSSDSIFLIVANAQADWSASSLCAKSSALRRRRTHSPKENVSAMRYGSSYVVQSCHSLYSKGPAQGFNHGSGLYPPVVQLWLLLKDADQPIGILIAGIHMDAPLFRHRRWVEGRPYM